LAAYLMAYPVAFFSFFFFLYSLRVRIDQSDAFKAKPLLVSFAIPLMWGLLMADFIIDPWGIWYWFWD